MGNLAEDIINLKVGDKVYLKSYEKVKHDVCLSENSWNRFYNKLLLVTNGDKWEDYIPVFIANGFYRNKTDSDDDFCTLFDEETHDCIEVPIYMIASVYKKGSSKVHHPDHYNQNGMEVWDVINAFTKDLEGAEAFYAGNAIKYILRWNHKNGIEDLEKAKVYIDKIIEGRKEQ